MHRPRIPYRSGVLYKLLNDTTCFVSSGDPRKRTMKLDNISFRRTRSSAVNPNTHKKFIFCARLHMAAGFALYICPERPGAAS